MILTHFLYESDGQKGYKMYGNVRTAGLSRNTKRMLKLRYTGLDNGRAL